MWWLFKCFYTDEPLVEVVFHVALKRKPVVIGKNQFKSFKSMNDLIEFIGYSGTYELEVENEIIDKYSHPYIYKDICILKGPNCVHIRMRPLYGRR
jgi:hypothetical protein